MGNLSKLIIAGLAAIILNKGIAQEPGKTLYVSEQQIEYYKKEPNKSDMIFKTGYLDVNKKVTLAYGYEHSKYINMINPESIIDFTSRINSMGRSNTQIANQFFYILRTKGVKYEPDPVDPCYIEITNKKNEEFLQDYAEYLAARILSGESGHIIFCAPTKDYLKDPSQTLEKNKDGVLEGGD